MIKQGGFSLIHVSNEEAIQGKTVYEIVFSKGDIEISNGRFFNTVMRGYHFERIKEGNVVFKIKSIENITSYIEKSGTFNLSEDGKGINILLTHSMNLLHDKSAIFKDIKESTSG